MTCKARRHSDQMCCGRCGHSWDVNDPDPPECLTDEQIAARKIRPRGKSTLGRQILDQLIEDLKR